MTVHEISRIFPKKHAILPLQHKAESSLIFQLLQLRIHFMLRNLILKSVPQCQFSKPDTHSGLPT